MHRGLHRGARACRSTTATATSVTHDEFDQLVDDLARRRASTTRSRRTARSARVRQHIPADRAAGAVAARRQHASRSWIVSRAPTPRPADDRASWPSPTRPKIVTGRASTTTTPTRSPRYEATGGYEACARRSTDDARRGRRRGQGRQPARPRRRRLPRRREVGLLPARRVAALPRRQRRRERARHLQGPPPHGARSAPAHRGHPHRLLRGRLLAGLPLRPRRDGPGPGAHRQGAQRGVRRRLHRPQHPRHRLLASTSSCTGAPAPTSWARRRRSSRASRATAACRG